MGMKDTTRKRGDYMGKATKAKSAPKKSGSSRKGC